MRGAYTKEYGMPKKLSLSTETLRVLADEKLVGVVGAAKSGAKRKCKRSGAKRQTPTPSCPGNR